MDGLNIPLILPDLWQQDAVRALKAGRDVVVDAPTGAGKTWIFELFFEQANPKAKLARHKARSSFSCSYRITKRSVVVSSAVFSV